MTDRIHCNEPTPLTVTTQGAVVVTGATVVHRSERLAVVEVDCATKYARLLVSQGDRGSILHFDVTEHSLHQHAEATGWTEVQLPEFAGWYVDLHDYELRYGALVLFVRKETP